MTDFPGLEKRETRGTRNPSRVELTVALCCDCEHVMQVIDDGLPGSRKARDPGHPTVGVELTVASCCDCEHAMQVIDDGLPGSRKARDPGHPPHSPDSWSCPTNPALIPWSVRQSPRIAAAPSRTAAFAPWHAFSTRPACCSPTCRSRTLPPGALPPNPGSRWALFTASSLTSNPSSTPLPSATSCNFALWWIRTSCGPCCSNSRIWKISIPAWCSIA